MLWVAHADSEFADINDEWEHFTGVSRGENLGPGWMRRIHPKDLAGWLKSFAEAFRLSKELSTRLRLERHDGQYRWMLVRANPLPTEGGQPGGFAGCCIDITDEREIADAVSDFSGRLIQAQEGERSRIARELHDDITQRMALLANGIQELDLPRLRLSTPQKKQRIQALKKLAIEISSDVQFLSRQLHPSKLQYLGLPAAIRSLCREVSLRHKVDVTCIVRDVPDKLPESISLNLFRTAQESLQNVVKHSRAQHALVELVGETAGIHLRISDDGVGFELNQENSSRGLGLTSMRERLNSVGGTFSVCSGRMTGTHVEGAVPMAQLAHG
ncbi:PAS domain-containing protein [Occallatibacter riparius]|uniref:PAS domain-containing protein n=1 Tax=Occallatibacter riparius TaxID=1002689 RepID=A0A9J7BU12_9BACT|nr:PAS domain-containing protein [Occallatibacter riparius]